MTSSPFVFDVTEQEFENKVLQPSRATPVVVDFWAPWCGPCRMLAPMLERLVAERKGAVLLAKVNTDVEERLAMLYQIDSLPTVIAFRDGKPFLDFMGVQSEAQIRAFLDRLAPSAAEKEALAAAQLEKSEPAQAEKLYRQALASDASLVSAQLGLARLLVQQEKNDEAAELLENLAADGDAAAEAERLSALVWLKRQAAGVGEEKSLRARLDAEPKNAQARFELGLRAAAAGNSQEALDLFLAAGELDRKLAGNQVREAMVKVFHVIGVRSPLADAYREKLSALLY
jgi:putative thioredoxin